MTDIEKAAKKSCVLITGQEDVLRARALKWLLEALQIEPDDFDIQTFDAQVSSSVDWIAAVGTRPFLAEKRVAIVRHLLQCEAPPNGPLFGKLPDFSLLVLVADSVGGSDDKKAKAATQAKNWEAIVKSSEGAILKYEPDPKAARDSVKAEAATRGVAISERALDTLVDMTGGSFSRSVEEFEKLSLYVGSSETISERHVEAIVTPSKEWNVFKLADAIVDSNAGDALVQLRVMVGNVSKAEDAAFSQILPQISRVLRLVWQARISIDMGSQGSEAFKAALPKRHNFTTVQPYQQTKFLRMARKTNLSSLEKCLQVVADTDAKLKGALAGFSAVDSLEMMVLELTTTIKAG